MLEVSGLTRRFGDRTVVDGVSFTVEPGLLTGFVGANGAGKTTTMRMIMGVLAATGGEVLWNGRPIGAEDRSSFGYMPEERGLYPKQPIIAQLAYLGQLRGLDPDAARGRAIDLLDRFGLAGRAKDRLESLSLGNQQRVQIAAALLHGPSALILDEPFSGLDPLAVDSMVDLTREHLDQGVPVLFSSHQLDLVDRLCDRLIVLSAGHVVAQGTADELRAAGPRRYRFVDDVDAGWVRGQSGVFAVDVAGPVAILETDDDASRHALVRAAAQRGTLAEFAPLVPSLGDIYREAVR